MKIKSLALENYRGIDSLHIEFNPDITIIIGRNGAGKSSILDATAALLTAVQLAWRTNDFEPQYAGVAVSEPDRRDGSDRTTIKLSLDFNGDIPKQDVKSSISWSTVYQQQSENPDYSSLWFAAQRGQLASLERPLIVYYRQDRGFEDGGTSYDIVDKRTTIITSLQGRLHAIKQLQVWWDKRDAQEARTVRDINPNFRDPQLEAIRSLIREIEGFQNVTYSSTNIPEGLYFVKDDGSSVHVNNLSSGERSYIILLADLARRLQMMYPDRSLSEIPGIVLIDEIELNLHPAWQSKIIATLRAVFRNCQFLVTTHSPQVITSITSDHVRIIQRDRDGKLQLEKPLKTMGQTSNYLLEGVFGAHERFPDVDKLIFEFNTAIEKKQKKHAANLLSRIIEQVEGDSPELLVLRKRLNALGEQR